jgi:hypothetical protein
VAEQLSADDQSVIVRHAGVLVDYKNFCAQLDKPELMAAEDREYLGDDPFEETDFKDLSVGYFIGKGVSWTDSFKLARICRYSLEGFA